MPIPGIVSGSGFSGSFRCCSEDVRRALAECCSTAYGVGILCRVRDPGDSRRASLKLVLLVPMGDPGDSHVIPAIRAGPH